MAAQCWQKPKASRLFLDRLYVSHVNPDHTLYSTIFIWNFVSSNWILMSFLWGALVLQNILQRINQNRNAGSCCVAEYLISAFIFNKLPCCHRDSVRAGLIVGQRRRPEPAADNIVEVHQAPLDSASIHMTHKRCSLHRQNRPHPSRYRTSTTSFWFTAYFICLGTDTISEKCCSVQNTTKIQFKYFIESIWVHRDWRRCHSCLYIRVFSFYASMVKFCLLNNWFYFSFAVQI